MDDYCKYLKEIDSKKTKEQLAAEDYFYAKIDCAEQTLKTFLESFSKNESFIENLMFPDKAKCSSLIISLLCLRNWYDIKQSVFLNWEDLNDGHINPPESLYLNVADSAKSAHDIHEADVICDVMDQIVRHKYIMNCPHLVTEKEFEQFMIICKSCADLITQNAGFKKKHFQT